MKVDKLPPRPRFDAAAGDGRDRLSKFRGPAVGVRFGSQVAISYRLNERPFTGLAVHRGDDHKGRKADSPVGNCYLETMEKYGNLALPHLWIKP